MCIRDSAHCLIQGTSLPIIDSVDKNRFIQERIKTATWLNLQKTSSWRWGNGNAVNYNNWFSGQPKNLANHNCAVVENQGANVGWRTDICSNCHNTICEKGRANHLSQFDFTA